MKETIKIVMVDVDGTLLNSKKQVTDKTREAISRLAEHHILFSIATGRTPYAVVHLVKDWGIDEYCDYIMGFNGAAILNMKTKELTSNFLVEGKYMAEVRELLKGFDVNFGIYDKESYHAMKEDEYAKGIAEANKLPLIIEDLSSYNDKKFEKMLLTAKTDEINKVVDYYNKNIHSEHYRAVQSTPTIFEFLNPELSKAKGIEGLCNQLGMKMENVLTFGDEMNDYEMIKDCVGVAMGNAVQPVKDVAKYVTLSNDEDGIADFLNKNIYNEQKK